MTIWVSTPDNHQQRRAELPTKSANTERWQSGRLCSTGNAVSSKGDRGFESLPLRSFSQPVKQKLLFYRLFSYCGSANRFLGNQMMHCDGIRIASLSVLAVNLPEVQSPAAMNRRTWNSGETDPAVVRIFTRGIKQKLTEVTKGRGRGSPWNLPPVAFRRCQVRSDDDLAVGLTEKIVGLTAVVDRAQIVHKPRGLQQASESCQNMQVRA